MTEEVQEKRPITPPTMWDALIPVVSLIVLLALAVILYGADGIAGPIQVALMICTIIAMLVGKRNGHSMADMAHAAVEGISTAMGAIFILLAVGALVGTWSMSGTIATLVYYGVKIIDPNWFYLACVIICGILALSIGSAWTVAGTIGVGLIGIANALGVSEAMTAGAVISGAYFGDKMSPLSETTNLAPTVAGTDLYSHIKGMMWTAVPSIVIAMAIYTFIGLRAVPEAQLDLTIVLEVLESVFNITLWTLVPLLFVLVMSLRKISAFFTIMTGALIGGLTAIILQPDVDRANTDKKLVASTGLTSIGLNILAGDQYMAIVLPGRMFRPLYEERGIAPETLSREIEDTGTITSPLIPWNSCGAYMSATLGVATAAYLPFCFFNWINVIISFIYAATGFQINHVEPEKEKLAEPESVELYGVGNRRVDPTTPEEANPVSAINPA